MGTQEAIWVHRRLYEVKTRSYRLVHRSKQRTSSLCTMKVDMIVSTFIMCIICNFSYFCKRCIEMRLILFFMKSVSLSSIIIVSLSICMPSFCSLFSTDLELYMTEFCYCTPVLISCAVPTTSVIFVNLREKFCQPTPQTKKGFGNEMVPGERVGITNQTDKQDGLFFACLQVLIIGFFICSVCSL